MIACAMQVPVYKKKRGTTASSSDKAQTPPGIPQKKENRGAIQTPRSSKAASEKGSRGGQIEDISLICR